MTAQPPNRRILLVTGLSGAGKSSALKMLEDMGWEVVDNLPLLMLDALVALDPEETNASPLAIGIDTRTRGFDSDLVSRRLDGLRQQPNQDTRLCFLDAASDVLQQRFTETRRRHPLATDRTMMDGVRHERELLSRLRDRADYVIDTSNVALPALREMLRARFALEGPAALQVSLTSFSFRRGLPRDADLILDVRFLRNPYYDVDLKELTGQDEVIHEYIRSDPDWSEFEQRSGGLLDFLTPRYGREGKAYLTIAFGCTGGRHRSVFCAELFGTRLRTQGHHVTVRHRDL
jgi:UPF0042 nucleotide-binding protein